jgi:hypothetical protein
MIRLCNERLFRLDGAADGVIDLARAEPGGISSRPRAVCLESPRAIGLDRNRTGPTGLD